jgi:chromosome segregation ATPase
VENLEEFENIKSESGSGSGGSGSGGYGSGGYGGGGYGGGGYGGGPLGGGTSGSNWDESDMDDGNTEGSRHSEIVIDRIPEIKGMALLREEIDTLDLGKTIREMFLSIHNMESQLTRVLSINAALEKDLKSSRELIVELRKEKLSLEETIDSINTAIPAKKELQAEVEYLVEERNRAHYSVQEMKAMLEKARAETVELKRRNGELDVEKTDLRKDVDYLELKMSAAVEKINAHARQINILKGERLAVLEDMKNLRSKYERCVSEKMEIEKAALGIS